ncbi:MAG TPA: hypothetical protein VFT22_05630, partial [Kofleriaceae bacterium]|nr:hypothetical protein [Kofleriaceae bacterium]
VWTDEAGKATLAHHEAPGRRESAIRRIAAGRDWIATASDDGSVSVWRLDGTELARLSASRTPRAGRAAAAPQIAFSLDDAPLALAIGSRTGDVEIATLGPPLPDSAPALIQRALRTEPTPR